MKVTLGRSGKTAEGSLDCRGGKIGEHCYLHDVLGSAGLRLAVLHQWTTISDRLNQRGLFSTVAQKNFRIQKIARDGCKIQLWGISGGRVCQGNLTSHGGTRYLRPIIALPRLGAKLCQLND